MSKPIQVLCLLAALPAYLPAQSGLGSITGTVQDSSGGLIAGASVRLTENATKSTQATTANEAGLFTFPSVVVGTYTVVVSHPGFKEKKIENLTINAFQKVALSQIT